MAETPTLFASGTITPTISTRSVADAVTNSTVLVTSATAAFATTDVNRRVTGSADLGVFNYIASRASTTNVNLAIAATGGHTAQTLNLTQEFVLAVATAPGVYQLVVDKSNMADGDGLELIVYRVCKATATPQVPYEDTFYDAQLANDVVAEGPLIGTPFTDNWALVFTLNQLKGTARSFDWFVQQF